MILPRIIAIIGHKYSGKDTVSEMIHELYGHQHLKISSRLKHCVKELFDLTDEDVETEKKDVINEKLGITPRKLLQFFGTEIMQYKIQEILPNIGRNFWIKHLTNAIKSTDYVVISDVRFLHEYDMLKKLDDNLMVIKVSRDQTKQRDDHISEHEYEQIPFHFHLKNNGNTKNDIYNYFDNEKLFGRNNT